MSTRRLTLRPGPFSVRLDLRVLGVLALLAAAILVVLTVHVARGDFALSAGEVLSALVGAGDQATDFIVLDLRLPRALAAILAGAALGVAGMIFQDVARNPLVSPDIIGVTLGASLAAVSLIVFTDSGGSLSVPGAALGGALAAGLALYLLAWRGGLQGYRLVLIGIGLAALLNAGVLWVLTRGEIFQVSQATVWLVGSLNGRSWEQVWPLAATLALLLPLALALTRQLQVMQLGDEMARALGLRLERSRAALVALAVVLVGVAVSATGPIAFVAFIAPHIARRLCGTVLPSGVLPVAAGAGALLVLSADVVGRLAFGSTEVPVGILTSVLAAPYFLYLLQRANRLGVSG